MHNRDSRLLEHEEVRGAGVLWEEKEDGREGLAMVMRKEREVTRVRAGEGDKG